MLLMSSTSTVFPSDINSVISFSLCYSQHTLHVNLSLHHPTRLVQWPLFSLKTMPRLQVRLNLSYNRLNYSLDTYHHFVSSDVNSLCSISFHCSGQPYAMSEYYARYGPSPLTIRLTMHHPIS